MLFKIEEWTIKDLLSVYGEGKLNIDPPYQRNDIWSNPAKRRLIDSIKRGYPLPIFFLHEKSNKKYDMVDGQQRTRAIYGYKEGYFKDLDNISFEKSNKENFLDYKISVSIIFDIEDENILSDFYYRVNKFGTKLNRPEILKAQFSQTRFQDLVTTVADSQEFTSLNLFAPSTLNRMIDLDFVGELLAYIKFGITDKKKAADSLYENDIDSESTERLYSTSMEILSIFNAFNVINLISKTRYKQRNDFYTLWGFIRDNIGINKETLTYFYKILVLIDNDISPTNDECQAFQNYAYHCVTQSNSKNARENRRNFLDDLFLNIEGEPNVMQKEILNYYDLNEKNIMKKDQFLTLDGKSIQSVVGLPQLF